jgi:DNA topoisomerase-1
MDRDDTGFGNRFALPLLEMARMLPAAWRKLKTVEPPDRSAQAAGLRYVCDARTPGIRRIGRHNRFRYVDPHGRTVADAAEIRRIKSLAIPPAWTDVWICLDPHGHLQATGRDARRRKQYRYHPRWREVRDEVKYARLIAFARALPRIRERAAADLRKAGLPRDKVLAAVVQLLEKTLIRVGNDEYAKANGSIGLTTMRDQHAKVNGSTVRFEFRGKSGIQRAVNLHDARLARIIKACRDLPGYELFQYVDDERKRQVIDSADVNAYLREIAGDDFTAKDFRTWAGTMLAAGELATAGRFSSAAEGKRKIVRAVEAVARRLGNTRAVCRKSYIHPAIFDAYLEGARIAATEPAIVATIRRRLRAA